MASDKVCKHEDCEKLALFDEDNCWEHLAGQQKRGFKIHIEHQKAKLFGAVLQEADLVAAELGGAKMGGAKLEGANLSRAKMQGADICHAKLNGAILNHTHLAQTIAECADFSDADLTKADLRGASLQSAEFNNARLDGVNLEGATLIAASMRGASLRQAWIRGVLHGWDMDLRDAGLFDVNLEGSNIWNSDLRGASLRGANLTRTDLRYSDIRNADLSLAKMNEADLREIKQTLYTVSTMFRDALRSRDGRIQITRWDGADGIDRARMTPAARRYVKWISRVEDYRAHNPANAFMLRWLLFYGKSYILFFIQIAILAFIFGFAYADYTCPQWLPEPIAGFLSVIDPKVGEVYELSLDGYASDGFVPYYYSIVTMTTLGFGDVVPLNLPGRLFVVVEVILGYIYLGVLISVFASGIVQFIKGD